MQMKQKTATHRAESDAGRVDPRIGSGRVGSAKSDPRQTLVQTTVDSYVVVVMRANLASSSNELCVFS
jgi:hypothetical protein